MNYASFDFYKSNYMGVSIGDEVEFRRLATRASSYLDYFTQGRAKRYSELEELKMACCALAEQYKIIEKYQTESAGESGELQSQSVGEWSKTYRSRDEAAKAAVGELAKLATQYLAASGLLYRGMSCVSSHCNCL